MRPHRTVNLNLQKADRATESDPEPSSQAPEPGTPELGRRKPRFVRLSFESARGKEIQARLDEKHAAEAMATGSYKNRRASAPANLKPLPEDKAEGSGRRSRRRSLGTLVSKKTEVEATEGEMVRKGKKGAAPPPPVKHSFEWE